MEKFFTSNETKYKLLRTIVEAVLGVFLANLDYIVGLAKLTPEMRALVCAFIVAILSPIISEIGKAVYKKDESK